MVKGDSTEINIVCSEDPIILAVEQSNRSLRALAVLRTDPTELCI